MKMTTARLPTEECVNLTMLELLPINQVVRVDEEISGSIYFPYIVLYNPCDDNSPELTAPQQKGARAGVRRQREEDTVEEKLKQPDHISVLVPLDRNVRALGEAIKAFAGELTIADRFNTREMATVTRSLLILETVENPRFLAIHNLKPIDSSTLCYYLTGFIPYGSMMFLETALNLEPRTIKNKVDYKKYQVQLLEDVKERVTSDAYIC